LPVLQDVSTDLTKFLSDTKKEVGGFDKLGQTIAVSIVESTKGFIEGVAGFLDSLNNLITGIRLGLKDIEGGLLVATLHFQQVNQSLFGLFIDLNKEIIDTKINLMKLSSEIFALGDGASTAFADMAKVTSASLDKVIKKLQQTKDAQDEIVGGEGGDDDKTKPLLVGMEEFKNSIGVTDEALGKLGIDSMKKFEDSIIDSLKNGKLAFKDFANYVIEQLLRIAIQEAVLKPLTSSFSNFFGNIFPSADGGGYTGMGARAGGVDGKGGFPAILHPNETVVDHTKGQGMGATVNFNISTVDAAGFDQLLASRKGLITSIINNAMNNQGKMGVV